MLLLAVGALLFLPRCAALSAEKASLIADLSVDLAFNFNAKCICLLFPPGWLRSHRPQLLMLIKGISTKFAVTTNFFSFPEYFLHRTSKPVTSCTLPLYIFIDGGPETRRAFTRISNSFLMSTSVWVLFPGAPDEEFYSDAKLPFNSEIVSARILNESGLVEFHELYRVTRDHDLRVVNFGQWQRSSGLSVVTGGLYSRRTDLEGVVLKTGSLENWPLSTFQGSQHAGAAWDGYYPRVWKELEQLMNCSSVNLRGKGNATGVPQPDGQWNGLVGMTLQGEIDVIVSELTINEARSYVLDFSHPLSTSKYQVYYPHPGYSLKWTAVFKPLAFNTWLAIVTWLLVGTCAMSLCHYVCLRHGYEGGKDTEWFSPTLSFFFMIQSLSQQGCTTVPRSAACRIIFLASYLVSAVVIPAYAASLISFLTKQTPLRPIDSLEAMLADGTYKLIVGRNTAEYSLFMNATDTIYQEVYERLISTVPLQDVQNNSVEALKLLCNRSKYAVFGVDEVITARIQAVPTLCTLIPFSQSLSTVYQSMGLVRGSPYSGLINHQLQKMFNSGVVNRVRQSVWPRAKVDFTPQWSEVQVAEVSQMFVYLLFAFIISSFVFYVEKQKARHAAATKKHKSARKIKHMSLLAIEPFLD